LDRFTALNFVVLKRNKQLPAREKVVIKAR